jgi:hypothetical protein
MEIPPVIVACDIRYTDDAAHVTFFFENHMQVTITFTHGNKDAQNIVSTQWTDIEPASARVRTPAHNQKVVIGDLNIINVPGYPLLFCGHIDVSRRGASDSVECWRSHIAMNIELPCSPPDESASECARESASESGCESGIESGCECDDDTVPNTDDEGIMVVDATSESDDDP